ncbi:MAG: DUF3568 family protein [Desulfobacterales bacterium]
MGQRRQHKNIIWTLMALILMCNGCTTSLLVGSMSAAPSGATYVSTVGGKIESYQAVTFENALKATRLAVATLSLDVKQEEIDADRASFQYADKNGHRMDVVIEQRTATMTYLMVNTGWFGVHGMGRLLMRQILLEISDAGDLLE